MHCNYEVSWVVKFSPKDKQDNPWYDVSHEISACIIIIIFGANTLGSNV